MASAWIHEQMIVDEGSVTGIQSATANEELTADGFSPNVVLEDDGDGDKSGGLDDEDKELDDDEFDEEDVDEEELDEFDEDAEDEDLDDEFDDDDEDDDDDF